MYGSLSVRLYTSISQAVNQILTRLSRISLSVGLFVDVCQSACFFARMRESVCLSLQLSVFLSLQLLLVFVCRSVCLSRIW